MGRPKKVVEEKVESKGEFGQKEADKLAASFIPKDEKDRYNVVMQNGKEVNIDKFDVMYVTEDKNVFFKNKEGEARSHARKRNLKIFTVLNDE